MENVFFKALLAFVLPVAVFVCGVWVMSKMSNRAYVDERLSNEASPKDRKPLNQRLGYDLGAVDRHWGALDSTGLHIERRFLELDLVFPFLYGAALLSGLLIAWVGIGRPFHSAWLVAPVAITVVADWVENTVQLVQLDRYLGGGAAALESNWILVASGATVVKLVFFLGVSVFLVGLIVTMVIQAYRAA